MNPHRRDEGNARFPLIYRYLRAALAAVAMMAIAACASTSPPIPAIRTPESIAGLVALLDQREGNLHSVDARFQIDLRIDGIRQKGNGALFWRKGTALKLDVSDRLLGIGVLSALAYGDSLCVHLPRENRYLRGDAADVLYHVTGVDVSYYGLHRAILGLPNLASSDIHRATRFEARSDTLIVEVVDPLWTRHLRIHGPTGVLLEERIFAPDGRRLSTRYLSDYRVQGGMPLPGTIRILQDSDRITLRYRRQTVNLGVPDDRLRLNLPSDAIDLSQIN
jgi:outer membrane biogenesis lipoprotein LolB